MGLNRMMMKSNIFLKDIEAIMVVGYSGGRLGFIDGSFGELLPNPLPNGVHVSAVACSTSMDTQLLPATIKSCTFEEIGVTLTHGDMDVEAVNAIGQYLSNSMSKPIPITFHF